MDTIAYNSLSLAFDGTNPQAIARNIGEQLRGLQEDLKQRRLQLTTSQRRLHYELPITDWLGKYLDETLKSHGFIVDTQAKLIKANAPANE